MKLDEKYWPIMSVIYRHKDEFGVYPGVSYFHKVLYGSTLAHRENFLEIKNLGLVKQRREDKKITWADESFKGLIPAHRGSYFPAPSGAKIRFNEWFSRPLVV